MPLKSELFDASKLAMLSDFDCGDDEFGKIATSWIKCDVPADSALEDIANRGTVVFLYFDENDRVVGFGSVGVTTYTIKHVKRNWSIIPHLGLDVRFRGLPADAAPRDRYSSLILDDLIETCRAEHGTEFLTLKVHQNNLGAIKLYERHGFTRLDNQVDSRGYIRMNLPLNAPKSAP